jgi:hypothetical protein
MCISGLFANHDLKYHYNYVLITLYYLELIRETEPKFSSDEEMEEPPLKVKVFPMKDALSSARRGWQNLRKKMEESWKINRSQAEELMNKSDKVSHLEKQIAMETQINSLLAVEVDNDCGTDREVKKQLKTYHKNIRDLEGRNDTLTKEIHKLEGLVETQRGKIFEQNDTLLQWMPNNPFGSFPTLMSPLQDMPPHTNLEDAEDKEEKQRNLNSSQAEELEKKSDKATILHSLALEVENERGTVRELQMQLQTYRENIRDLEGKNETLTEEVDKLERHVDNQRGTIVKQNDTLLKDNPFDTSIIMSPPGTDHEDTELPAIITPTAPPPPGTNPEEAEDKLDLSDLPALITPTASPPPGTNPEGAVDKHDIPDLPKTEVARHGCTLCKKTFKTDGALRVHKSCKHDKTSGFTRTKRCGKCLKSISVKNYSRHVNNCKVKVEH